MNTLAIPEPTDLDFEDRVVALAEQARVWLAEASDTTAVDDLRAQAAAIETYLRRRGAGVNALAEALGMQRRAEVRLGQLIPPEPGKRTDLSHASDRLPGTAMDRLRFRLLAAAVDKVEAALSELREHASRNAVLRFVRLDDQQRIDEREAEANRRASSIPPPLADLGEFAVVYADPPWETDHLSPSRRIENQYPTMSLDEIGALTPPAAPDSVLLLWTLAHKIRDGLDVMAAWGFEYRTQMVWVKDRIGVGTWVRVRHEPLLIGRRGNFAAPVPSRRPGSVIEAPYTGHSVKPRLHDLLDRMWPGVPKIEMFARDPVDSPWRSTWGNEA